MHSSRTHTVAGISEHPIKHSELGICVSLLNQVFNTVRWENISIMLWLYIGKIPRRAIAHVCMTMTI